MYDTCGDMMLSGCDAILVACQLTIRISNHRIPGDATSRYYSNVTYARPAPGYAPAAEARHVGAPGCFRAVDLDVYACHTTAVLKSKFSMYSCVPLYSVLQYTRVPRYLVQ
jgi:hypothetical protein